MTTERVRAVRLAALLATALAAEAHAAPQIVVSLEGATLRVSDAGRPLRVFPVGVGRDAKAASMYTGPDPGDRSFYLPARHEPAFHRGLPYLRLDHRSGSVEGAPAHPFSIHGPVTPTLIWGRVSAGCVRMRPADLRWLYRLAIRHPSLRVSFVAGPDALASLDRLAAGRRADAGCPDAALGARRLRPISLEHPHHDRLCGGVDHWYAVELRGGETISVRLAHAGGLRAELYGLRAISTVAEGAQGFEHRVPALHRYRGARYLRIAPAPSLRGAAAYTLTVTVR